MSRRFLVTGADGFVGAHIVDYLLEHGYDVVCLLRRDGQRRLPMVLAKYRDRQVKVVRHDLSAPITPIVAAQLGRIDVVINAASSTDIAGSLTDPAGVFQHNTELIANLAEWARRQDLEAFVQISSEEVYGPAYGEPHREWEPIRPSTHYSASKAAQEAYLIASWRAHGLPLLILNCMNMIGPMQESTKLVPTILRKLLAGEMVPLIVNWYEPQSGSGEESLRQYMHPRVLASAILATVDKAEVFTPRIPLPARYNIAGTQIGNVALARMVADAAGLPLHWSPVDAVQTRPGHERVFALNYSKIRALGWKAPSTLEDDIRDTVAWYAENPEWL